MSKHASNRQTFLNGLNSSRKKTGFFIWGPFKLEFHHIRLKKIEYEKILEFCN